MRNDIRRLLIITSIAILLAGCAHVIERGGFTACAAARTCTIGGKLQLFPGEPAGAAIISGDGNCVKLALPEVFYAEPLLRTWHNRTVSVQGQAFIQPNLQTDLGVLSWYAEKDRKLAIGICDQGLGIYVDTMRARSGETWPDRAVGDEAR